MTTYDSSLIVFRTKNMPSSTTKALQKYQTRKSPNYFFRWASSKLWLFHEGFDTKQ